MVVSMKFVRILDCTLRDGGYCNQWDFGETNIHAHDNVHVILHNSDYVWATDNVFIKSLFKPKKMCLRNAAINFAQQEYKVYYSSLSTLKFEKTK